MEDLRRWKYYLITEIERLNDFARTQTYANEIFKLPRLRMNKNENFHFQESKNESGLVSLDSSTQKNEPRRCGCPSWVDVVDSLAVSRDKHLACR
jgi:hypothetical protein